METLQIQSAGAVAPPLPASTVVSGTPTGDNAFASSLDRAIENMPNPVQDGASIAPKVSPASPGGKGTAHDISGSASMAGIFLNCFVTNILQPAPSIALNGNVAGSGVGLPSLASTGGTPPNVVSSVSSSKGETSTNRGIISLPGAMGGFVAPGALITWAAKGVGAARVTKPESSKSALREAGQVAIGSGGLVLTAGQNRSEDAAIPQSVSPSAPFPGLQALSLPGQPVEQQVGVALSGLDQPQASNPGSTRDPGFQVETQTLPSFTDSRPLSGQLNFTLKPGFAGCFPFRPARRPNRTSNSCGRPCGRQPFHTDRHNRSSRADRICEPVGNDCRSEWTSNLQSHTVLWPNRTTRS